MRQGNTCTVNGRVAVEKREEHACLTRRVIGAAKFYNLPMTVKILGSYFPQEAIRRVYWRVVSPEPETE